MKKVLFRFFHKQSIYFSCIIPFALSVLPTSFKAQMAADSIEKSSVLSVVVKQTVPFVFRDSDRLKGYSIDLLNLLSKECGFTYSVSEVSSTPKLIEEVSQKKHDIGVGATSITEEREKIVDFSHPFFESGLQILVRKSGDNGPWATIKKVFNSEFFGLIGILCLIVLFISHLLWLVERKRNSESFPIKYLTGIGESIWWSISTLVSGGCENKGPVGFPGRLVAFIWMLGAILLTTFITASLTASMTVNTLSSDIKGISDLRGKKIGTISGGYAEGYLKKSGYNVIGQKTIDDAIPQLENGKVSGIVFDSPVLNYYVNTHPGSNFQVIGPIFENQNYGFVLPLGSNLRKDINKALLKLQFSGALNDLKKKWFDSE